ncbi:MAG: tetratricopeptide repeat protein, partial [Burkholderiales bacterium]
VSSMNPYSIDVTTSSFAEDVIAASHDRPVVVDFWAPWCGPCRALAPILERLSVGYAGRFRLAKLNTDEHPDIASRYGIRGIPNVKAFVAGVVVDEFAGVLSETQVRTFLDRLAPAPAEVARRAARALVLAGDFDAAETQLRASLELDPSLVATRLDAADLALARQDFITAESMLDAVDPDAGGERFEGLRTRVDAWKNTRTLPDARELLARIDENPGDLETRAALAERLIAGLELEAALEQLLDIVMRAHAPADRARRESARRAMLRVFTLAAEQIDLVSRYRRLLAAALN